MTRHGIVPLRWSEVSDRFANFRMGEVAAERFH
jgi:hypothetical protein